MSVYLYLMMYCVLKCIDAFGIFYGDENLTFSSELPTIKAQANGCAVSVGSLCLKNKQNTFTNLNVQPLIYCWLILYLLDNSFFDITSTLWFFSIKMIMEYEVSCTCPKIKLFVDFILPLPET